jgi:hypothetical protein
MSGTYLPRDTLYNKDEETAYDQERLIRRLRKEGGQV